MRSIISLCLFVLAVASVACNPADTSNRSNANTTTTTNRPGTDVATTNSPTTSTTAPGVDPATGAALITVAQLRERLAKNDVTIVDVRGAAAYQQRHIKGAISMPLEQVASRAGELPKGKTIVTYCTCPAEQTSARAVIDLKGKNITDAVALKGGMDAYIAAGLPVEPAK